ncbi:MAG: transcriptional regulator [Magnetococcales bacterium]|nr:transcriptional regulator [Magnetococcales bacterium]MBF0157510.1 transcriptional regulator [Magnetococcales bacterium]
MITPDQCRMARAILGWSLVDLVEQTGLALNTIHRFEHGGNTFTSTVNTLRHAFENHGIEFIPETPHSFATIRRRKPEAIASLLEPPPHSGRTRCRA